MNTFFFYYRYYLSVFSRFCKKIFFGSGKFLLNIFLLLSIFITLHIWLHLPQRLYFFLDSLENQSENQNNDQSKNQKGKQKINFSIPFGSHKNYSVKEIQDRLYSYEKKFYNYIEQKYFLKRPIRFAYLDSFFKQIAQLDIYYYRMGEQEKKLWNFFVSSQLAQNEWHEKNGWFMPNENIRYRFPFLYAYYFGKRENVNIDSASGIYVNGNQLSPKRILKHIAYCKKNNLNALVVDIKDVTGFLNYQSNSPVLKKIQRGIHPPIKNLKQYVSFLKKHNIYVIARVSLFHDFLLGKKAPHVVLRHANAEPYRSGKNTLWVDPSNNFVQNYNLLIIWQALQAGVDEIQLDYVRYPAEKKWKSVVYPNVKSYKDKISHLLFFLQRVHALTQAAGARLSIDVFGITVFQETGDIRSTGQDLVYLSQAADLLSPMVYPSHYADGFYGFAKPGDEPYPIVFMSLSKIKLFNEKIAVRPWLQAFSWRAKNYGSGYIQKQILASEHSGYPSFLLWNPSTRYPNFFRRTKKVRIKKLIEN